MEIQTSQFRYSKIIIYIFFVCCITSCIPTKKIAYVGSGEKVSGKYTPVAWSYKIQKGDRFHIKIVDPVSSISLGEKELVSSNVSANQGNLIFQQPSINDYVVDINGEVDIPILGRVQIEGIELSSLPIFLRNKCQGFITNPSISIFMTNYNVTVLGELRNPGFYQIITAKPTFFDAIGLAGDLTDFADRNEIQFQRKGENGNIIVEYVDVLDPSFIGSAYYYIQPNDVIHVRPLKVKKFSNGNALPLILSTITTLLTIITIARTN